MQGVYKGCQVQHEHIKVHYIYFKHRTSQQSNYRPCGNIKINSKGRILDTYKELQPTPWSRVLLERPTVVHSIKKLFSFYGT
jgi:hypothetical protein